MALLTGVQTQAVVASAARAATSLVAEISEDKSSAATGGVSVFLHGIELCEFSATPTVDHRPLYGERREWLAGISEP